MSLSNSDINDLRAKALHDVGDCDGESGRCEYCDEEQALEEDANKEMGIEEY